MPRAVELRLRGALEEYVSAYKGDNPRATGSRGVNADLVKQAESLLGGIGGEGKTASDTRRRERSCSRRRRAVAG
jgi:hypothetical protein